MLSILEHNIPQSICAMLSPELTRIRRNALTEKLASIQAQKWQFKTGDKKC